MEDKSILGFMPWGVSQIDWRNLEDRFKATNLKEDNLYRINYALNRVPQFIFAMLLNLNKRVIDLENELKEVQKCLK